MRFGEQPNEVFDYDGGRVLCLESKHGEDAGAFILVLEVIEEKVLSVVLVTSRLYPFMFQPDVAASQFFNIVEI
jgi:hypothetical protein